MSIRESHLLRQKLGKLGLALNLAVSMIPAHKKLVYNNLRGRGIVLETFYYKTNRLRLFQSNTCKYFEVFK